MAIAPKEEGLPSSKGRAGVRTARSPRKPRRPAAETREDILNTAEELFRTKGFTNVAMADVAAALGMSPANVFKHFHSKTHLVDAISVRHLEAMIDRLARPDDHKAPPERLLLFVEQLMESHLRDLQKSPHIFEMIVFSAGQKLPCAEQYREMLIDDIAQIIDAGVESGIYHVNDSRKTAEIVTMALACVLHPVLIAKEKADILATRCREVVSLIDTALQNPLAK